MSSEQPYQNFLDNNPYPRALKSYDFLPHHGSAVYLNYQGKKLINFSSSDYLGLATHPLLIERSQQYVQTLGVGSTASRLVSGNFSLYDALEKKIALAMKKPAALILGAGYQANTSVLEALLDPAILKQRALVFCDRLCHASLLATTRFVADVKRFQHNDLIHLATLLKKYAPDTRPKFIIVESIYSMDGDEVDFNALILLAKKYHAFLYVDDAHAVGMAGRLGYGKAPDYAADIDMIMGTFSKALGSFGAYIACSEIMRDYLINKCKGFIYSTGPSPAVLGAMDAALELVPAMQEARLRVVDYAARLRAFLRENNLDHGASQTHIVPWIIGDTEKTLAISVLLQEQGILGTPIRPPSVPVGKSRIRFCLTAAHSEEDIRHLLEVLRSVIHLNIKNNN
ncbi:MAG: 8-amino-7-oxononanoate synthase [Gammaproteobacteria bacterium]|jgi:8-amino-7-oxononanoate synthase|nr:8-amino-7-oxononanoate synthase [Gammaproteobacteria bacterium]